MIYWNLCDGALLNINQLVLANWLFYNVGAVTYMDARTNLIIANGKTITPNVSECVFDNVSNKWVIKFDNGKVYKYNRQNVIYLDKPAFINPQNCQIWHRKQLLYNVVAIYDFKGENIEYWHIVFANGSAQDYKFEELKVKKSVLENGDAKQIFDYFREVADFISVRTDDDTAILSQQYKKIDYLSEDTASALYLKPDTYKSIEEKKKSLSALCRQLSELRCKAALPLADQLREAMVDLNFLDVEFSITVTPMEEEFHADGYDQVEFWISTNPGETLRPLWQIASGGELSRIMLAFKTVFADKDETDTLIFDEIDAGISGKTAWKVAEKLGRLSRDHQIICITHLPQIASMEDSHFLIEKSVKKERTTTDIRLLSEEESLKELARLLGNGEMTKAVLENAREMKENARKVKLS